MTKRTDGCPAFPQHDIRDGEGMSLRDWFAATLPEPSREDVLRVMERERMANPHNEPYHNKVRRRGEREIICALRYEYADAMIAARSNPTN
jgi:hypothetical protein